jgi:hypothetical protein
MFAKNILMKPDEAFGFAAEHKLRIFRDIWHYTFNPVFQTQDFRLEKTDAGTVLYATEPHSQYDPLLIFASKGCGSHIRKLNAVLAEYDEKDKHERYIYWFLRTGTFNDFLSRRSQRSSSPKKHFPSLESYAKITASINGGLSITAFDRNDFAKCFDELKPPDHDSGKNVVEIFEKRNPAQAIELLKTAKIVHNGSVEAVAIAVDDGKSLTLENIAARRSSLGFGIILCTELVRYCCEKNYHSFNAAVSGVYGGYKHKIFLDSMDVFREPGGASRFFRFWEPGYANKISAKSGKIITRVFRNNLFNRNHDNNIQERPAK